MRRFLAVGVLLFAVFSVPGKADLCNARVSSGLQTHELFGMYSKAVFQVQVKKKASNGETVNSRVGTATLIDRRGYFITASHIFEEPGFWSEGLRGQIVLISPALGLELSAQEVFHRVSKTAPDLSVLLAQLPSGLGRLEIPELFGQVPAGATQAFMMGFPLASSEIHSHGFLPISLATDTSFVIVGGAASPRESGAVALTEVGDALGVLSGTDPGTSGVLNFTLANSATDWTFIPPTENVTRLLEGIKGVDLDSSSKGTLTHLGLDSLEALALFNALMKDVSIYEKGVRRHLMVIMRFFECSKMRGRALEIFNNFVGEKEVPIAIGLDVGRVALREAQALESAVPAMRMQQEKWLNLATALFTRSISGGVLNHLDRRSTSDAYLDFAVAVHDLNRIEPLKSRDEATTLLLREALDADHTNPRFLEVAQSLSLAPANQGDANRERTLLRRTVSEYRADGLSPAAARAVPPPYIEVWVLPSDSAELPSTASLLPFLALAGALLLLIALAIRALR